ncbi:dihydrolipoyl dehydrogenase [Roseicyclus sp.]
MSAEPLDVAIIGAGTAGLSARVEVAQVTDSYRVFDPGPYGTFCARAACMPSKALLHSAHAFHRRHTFETLGILGGEALEVDAARVMEETRKLRDSLVEGVKESMKPWRDTHLVPHAAILEPDGILRAGETRFRPLATVIATGSRAVVPDGWRDRLGDLLLTSDDIFELRDLPRRMAVIGLGPVGLELGQALARLGVEVTGFDPEATIGGLTDPDLLERLSRSLSDEVTIVNAAADPVATEDDAIRIKWDGGETEVDRILVAIGRRPNIGALGLETWNVVLDQDGRPDLPDGRLNLPGTRIYFAGDAGTGPALLHEASDEGRLAGYFAARDGDARFDRRTPLRMVFCEPQIALAGATWDTLKDRADEIAIGEASFDEAGRTRLQRAPGGGLRIYAEKATARILGAAIVAPEAEHLAHLLALAIERQDDLSALLRMPVYHPTHEEVLRRGLRRALKATALDATELDAIRCADAPVECDTD